MRNSRIVTLILSICFLAFTAQANDCQTPEFISVKDGASRHFIDLEETIKEVALEDLKRGETYKIFVSSQYEDCQPYFEKTNSRSGMVLEFVAEANTQTIEIKKPCDFNIEIRFSIACTSCERENSSRNLMGIMVDENFTPEELVQDVFIGGDCFDVEETSITFDGNLLSRGYFSNGANSINLEEGVLLSTGNIHSSAGPNDVYNTGNSFLDFGGDPDLTQMINSTVMYDVASLEFDFTPTTDQISFDFVFASEEYCEYVNSSFNDVFGFFISGPGINGPFSNNAQNIAVIPNTTTYTAINTVNHTSSSAYYVNNIPVSQHATMPSYLQCGGYPTTTNGVAINDIEYDGFTTAMTAMANVQACETYHIKLIIADVADGYFDSAVFLRANSFSSGETANVSTLAPGGVDANTAFENCDEGYFVFERTTDDLSFPVTVNYVVSTLSTATEGVDYEALPNSVVIPAGDSVLYLPVTIYDDLFTEGAESIILELDAPCSCDQPYALMYIEDVEPLAVVSDDLFFCDPVPLNIQPQITGGWGNYTYLWNTGDTTATLDILANSNATYVLTVTDECGNIAETTSMITIVETPTAIITGNELVCPESPDAEIQIAFTGTGPWDIVYSIDNVAQAPLSGITTNPFVMQTSSLGTFQVESVATYGCENVGQGMAIIAPVDLIIDATTTDETCPGADDGTISITVTGGTAPYTYVWNNGVGAIEDPINLPTAMYDLLVTDDNGCSMTASFQVGIDPNVPMANAGLDKTLDCNQITTSLSGTASTGTNYSYLWSTSDGNIVSGINTLTPIVDQPGIYHLNVTNNTTNCMTTDKTEVFIDTIAPIAAIDIIGPLVLNCTETTTVLDGSGSTPSNSLSYEWNTLDGNILSDLTIINPEVNAGGTYELTVTSTSNGCTDTETFFVGASVVLPDVNIAPASLLTCTDSVINLEADNSSSGIIYTTQWTTADGNIIGGGNTLNPAVDQPGTYSLTIFNTSNDCENTASVVVTEDRILPIADAGLATELDCNDEFVLLDGNQSSSGNNFSYQWSSNNGNIQNGLNSLSPEVTSAGTYSLLVTNTVNGCTAMDETMVIEDPDVPNAADIEIFAPECFGDEAEIAVTTVYGGEAPYQYSIDGGSSFYDENFFINLQPGAFEVLIQDAEGCLHEEQIIIPNVPELIVEVIRDVEIDLGDTYQLEANTSIPSFLLDSIAWTPDETLSCNDCLDPIAAPINTTNYQIMVTDENGCPAVADILVRVNKDRKIFIPNVFSPNGDGVNDHFMIFAKDNQVTNIANFQVFNRWGAKIFEIRDGLPNDFNFGWDGTMKGKAVNPSVFIYYAEIEFIDGEKVIYKGDITVAN